MESDFSFNLSCLINRNAGGSGFNGWGYKVEKCSWRARKTREKKPQFRWHLLSFKTAY